MYPLWIREVFLFLLFCLCGTEETYKMVRRNARLIPTTEKSGLATPLWSDSEFKTLLGEQMDLIVTEKVRQELTQKYEIHPDKTWSVDECKKVLGASIRKNNVKGIICCHREFSVTLATQQSQRNSELEKQNNELRARVSTLTKKLNPRAVQAAHLALQASSGMVLGQTVNVKCPHAVSALMNQAKVTSVTSSRWGNWLATLTAPNIVIQRAPVMNPSSCMMSAMTEFVLEDEGEMTHDCVTLTYAATSEIAETPIENAELELFVDGSAQVIEGNRRAGYAVTSNISLPPCKGKTDVLVVIDKFSRWVEAYPTGRATAAHTAKCLVTDFIPRWGLPDCIDSDQGTHFTGQVFKEVSRMLKIKWNLHCPYRPQASGQVERSNRTIKTRLSKMHQEGVPWVEALPAVLCSMRASPNRSVGLSPHEIITGRPMQMPGVIDLRNADVHIASDALIAYCENLTKAVQSAKERVESCWQTPPEGGHTIIPGQWVMIKSFRNKPLEPKWYGPHQVMLITAAAVLCQGWKTWTHVSHCKVVPPPAGIG